VFQLREKGKLFCIRMRNWNLRDKIKIYWEYWVHDWHFIAFTKLVELELAEFILLEVFFGY